MPNKSLKYNGNWVEDQFVPIMELFAQKAQNKQLHTKDTTVHPKLHHPTLLVFITIISSNVTIVQ